GETGDDGAFTATRVRASDELPQPPDKGQGGPGGPGGPGVVGQVTSIDGYTIVVENPQGDEESIVTTDDTEFVINDEAGSLSDIEVGMYVFAHGETDDDGAFTATQVRASDELPQPPDKGQGGPGGPRPPDRGQGQEPGNR
ncbi:MAG: DUF5666 domain-containing protein, partial [Chloroflexota bacterium]